MESADVVGCSMSVRVGCAFVTEVAAKELCVGPCGAFSFCCPELVDG